MMATYTTGHITSKDGTTIGYRQLGNGPAVILVHGGMMASQNFMKLGTVLSPSFTVYIPDRRGRGLSGPRGNNYSLKKEGEDILALAARTGATNIFGLSVGAIAVLQASLNGSPFCKIALYEPPLPVNGDIFTDWTERFDKEVAKGKLAAAMVTAMKKIDDPHTLFSRLPRFLLTPLLNFGIKAEAKSVKKNDVPLKTLIPTMHFEAQLIRESEAILKELKQIDVSVLLLGGTRSRAFLKEALNYLKTVLPNATSVTFKGAGHNLADNGEKPEIVAAELLQFFN